MKKTLTMLLMGLSLVVCGQAPLAAQSTQEAAPATLDDVLNRVEKRYSGPGFLVHFFQVSTLKAMKVSDYASGRILVKRPGMMRWEYKSPTPQLIIADSKEIWIYRPDDNQVSHGSAPAFFSGGNGAGFLADMTKIRKDFTTSLERTDQSDSFLIKLIPKSNTYEVSEIYLTVSAETDEITTLSTMNAYGDETKFELKGYRFDPELGPELFQFKVPEGVEVLQLDQ